MNQVHHNYMTKQQIKQAYHRGSIGYDFATELLQRLGISEYGADAYLFGANYN